MSTHNQSERKAKRFMVPLSILLVLLALIVPLIDCIALACAYSYLLAGAENAASAAASGGDYSECLTAMSADVNKNVVNGPSAKIVRMRPNGGYQNSGADLYIVASSFNGGKPNRISDFNQPVPSNIRIDTSVNVYECGVNLNFEVAPLINCSAVPVLNMIPGVGKSTSVAVNAVKAAKLPGGLIEVSK